MYPRRAEQVFLRTVPQSNLPKIQTTLQDDDHRFRNPLTPDPFAQKYPDTVESTLSSQASSIKFNSNGPYAGQYLAAGGADGLVEVWDVETRGVVRVLEGHVKAVGCVR